MIKCLHKAYRDQKNIAGKMERDSIMKFVGSDFQGKDMTFPPVSEWYLQYTQSA